MNQHLYQGKELDLFKSANNWKKYFGAFINPYIRGRVLEVGAGIGATTLALNEGVAQRWDLLEPDIALYQILVNEFSQKQASLSNISILNGTLSEIDQKEKYDLILYIDVLEHIQDDEKEIKKAAKLLNENGHLIILSPAFQFLYSPFDQELGHYKRYSKRCLRHLTPSSLKPITLKYLDSMGLFCSLFNKLVLKQHYPTATQINFWDKKLIPLSKFIDKLILYSFGKSILGIWKKMD